MKSFEERSREMDEEYNRRAWNMRLMGCVGFIFQVLFVAAVIVAVTKVIGLW